MLVVCYRVCGNLVVLGTEENKLDNGNGWNGKERELRVEAK